MALHDQNLTSVPILWSVILYIDTLSWSLPMTITCSHACSVLVNSDSEKDFISEIVAS